MYKERKKLYAEIAKIYNKNNLLPVKLWRKEKEIHADFAVASLTASVIATVCDKGLVKVEKTLDFCIEDTNRTCVPADGNVLLQKALSLSVRRRQQGIPCNEWHWAVCYAWGMAAHSGMGLDWKI